MNILNLRFELTNPWDKRDYFRNLGCISGKLIKNKAWELEHSYYSPMLVDADICWTRKQDHAGLRIVLGLLGYGIHVTIYDTRHWDYENNKWTIYEQISLD
jgi:hypothetical protein